MMRAVLAVLVMSGVARADVTQSIKGATVDWSDGTITAQGIGPADRHAPSPAVARDAALARAKKAAAARLIAAAEALPGAHGLDDKQLAPVADQATVATMDVGTDGSVTVALRIPIEAVRVAIAGPRAATPAVEAPPTTVIVDATKLKLKPQLGLEIGGWTGPVLFVDAMPDGDSELAGGHGGHRRATATKAAAGTLTIDGDPPAAGALAVVVISGKS
jgi:hypothetical protein